MMAWHIEASFKNDCNVDYLDVDESSYDASFVLDPAEIFDELPQPFRLINKTVEYIFDTAWEAIQESEKRANELGKLPVFHSGEEVPDPVQPTVISSSCDGKYIFTVAKRGVLYVLDAEITCTVAMNDELQGMAVLAISSGVMVNDKHLICLLFENDTAGVFVLSGRNLHLVSMFNEDTGLKGSSVSHISTSSDANYIAVCWHVGLQSTWIEIYKVPKEFWINEMSLVEEKMQAAQYNEDIDNKCADDSEKIQMDSIKDNSSDSEDDQPVSASQGGALTGHFNDTSFTKPTSILTIKSPPDPTPNPTSNVIVALKNMDMNYDIIGTGSNHILQQAYFDNSNIMFQDRNKKYLQYLAEKEDVCSYRIPTVHFLTSERFEQNDQSNSVLVYWSETHHSLIYSLLKKSKDVEDKPGVVLTTSAKILASDVSVCKCYIALGLENNNIIIWDKLKGFPVGVAHFHHSSSISGLYFIPTINKDHFKRLLVSFSDGALSMVEFSDDGNTVTVDLPCSTIKDPVIKMTSPSNLRHLVFIQRMSGKIFVLDSSTKMLICQIGLNKPTVPLEGFCLSKSLSLHVRGGHKDEYGEAILPESVHLYRLDIMKCPIMNNEICPTNEDSISKLTGFDHRISTLDEQRISSYEKRQRNYRIKWKQLESQLKKREPSSLEKSLWFSGTVAI